MWIYTCWVAAEETRSIDSGAGVIGSYDLPDMDTVDRSSCKICMCLQPVSHFLQLPYLGFV